jgi:hypothetical protein
MEIPYERPQTPPPRSYPMTPPPTGGQDKRTRFAETETGSNVKSKEGESPNSFFEEVASYLEDYEISDSETDPSVSDSAPSSPVSATSEAPKTITLQKHNPFASPVVADIVSATFNGPFPFMKLPLSVRRRVYEHLLVVPGIICVRQKHTSFHDEKKAFLYAERREFLPGIAYALAQLTVDGCKIRFSRFASTGINILCANKEVYTEAKAILYGKNAFEIVKPTNELCPPPDYSVRLFPTGCQRLVRDLNIRIRSFYDLSWLLNGGYNTLKNFYRGLQTLTLMLELDTANKGFGKAWCKKAGEKWTEYVERLRGEVAKELFRKMKKKTGKVVPTWMNLRVLFSGEAYDGMVGGGEGVEKVMRDELRQGLVETWELFKKGGK